jgi:hypothetical protein
VRLFAGRGRASCPRRRRRSLIVAVTQRYAGRHKPSGSAGPSYRGDSG